MKKLIVVIAVLLLACGTASAIGFDVRGGVNVSGMTFKPVGGSQFRLAPQVGWHASANVDFNIWKGLGIQAGLGLEERGAKDNDLLSVYSLNYLQLPVSVAYRYSLDDNLTVYAELGGWGAYGLWGNVRTEGKVYPAFGDFARRLDAGLLAGFGAELYGHLHFGFRYSYGLMNTATGDVSSTLGNFYTNGMCFQLGWRF